MAGSTAAANGIQIPPAPFPVDGSHNITINGTVYKFRADNIPLSDVQAMATWMNSIIQLHNTQDPHGNNTTLETAYINMNHSLVAKVVGSSGSISTGDAQTLAANYAQVAKPFNSVGVAPGVITAETGAEDAASGLETVGQFLGDLANPHLWTRVAEFAVGGILLAIAIDQLVKGGSGATRAVKSGSKLAVTPVALVGKGVKKAVER